MPFIRKVYLAGPMRGLPEYNREEFDRAEKLFRRFGFHVISPSATARAAGFQRGDPSVVEECPATLRYVMATDLAALAFADAIALLPGWEKSVGTTVELAFAQFLGLWVLDATTTRPFADREIPSTVPWTRLKAARLEAEKVHHLIKEQANASVRQ